MKFPELKRIAIFAAVSMLGIAGAFAEVPDVEMKLSTTTLDIGQELTATVSSKVYCDITMVAMGLDDSQFKEYKPAVHEVFNPPKQFKFKFAKAGKYRIAAMHGNMYCGNMGTVAMMTDIVVKPLPQPVMSLPMGGAIPVVAGPVTPKPATVPAPPPAPKPAAAPCKKPNKQGVGKDCDLN